MLAHLEYFNLPPLQLDISHSHLFLGHYLDCHVFASLLMCGCLHQTELPLAQGLLDLVVIGETRVANDLLDGLDPLNLFFIGLEVVGARLGRREDQSEGVEDCRVVEVLIWLVLDEDTYQVVHAFVFILLAVLIDVEFFSKQAIPVLFKFSLSGLPDHLALNLNRMLVILIKETFYSPPG
jgi:hypothetical protein